jgi:hypothetical protein
MAAHSLGEWYNLLGAVYQPSNLVARLIFREQGESSGQPTTVAFAAAWTLLNLTLAVGALAGAVVAVRRRQYTLALACVLTIALFAVATTSHGLERMRLPIMLPIVLLCGSLVRGTAKYQVPGDKRGTSPHANDSGVADSRASALASAELPMTTANQGP